MRAFETSAFVGDVCVSKGGQLFSMDAAMADSMRTRLLLDEVAKLGPDVGTLVELGCGYGHNLWSLSRRYPQCRYLGGEYSSSAVRLAARLYPDPKRLEVREFNFHDDGYDIFEHGGGARSRVVLTAHAVEQLPSARHLVERLIASRKSISQVLHLEPLYDAEDPTSLLGMLRRRYAEVNDYNRDLLSELRRRDEIQITDVRHDVLGLNPLNPTSVVRWRFVS